MWQARETFYVGGWVGGWVGWVEEKQAVGTSYCELGVGVVGGWVGDDLPTWVGGWVGGWVTLSIRRFLRRERRVV